MGAARMVLMGLVAIGAGAFLAVSTIPAFAPYQQRKADRVPRIGAQAPAIPVEQPLAYGYAAPNSQPSPEPGLSPDERSDQGSPVRYNAREGAVVIELPRWMEEGGAWMSLGQRAWRDWVEPGEEALGYDDRAPRHDRGRERDDDRGTYGSGRDMAQDYASPRTHRWRGDGDGYGDEAYGAARRWSQPESPEADYDDSPDRPPEYAPGRRADPATPAYDAAGIAAERARQAARDVRAAQSAAP